MPNLGLMSTSCATLGIMSLTPAQCRAARGLVEMDQARLAEQANVSRNVIVDFEKGRRTPTSNNLAAIQNALQLAGVEFVDAVNGRGEGVCLRVNDGSQGGFQRQVNTDPKPR